MAHYLDTSALVKLVFEEPESTELRQWVAVAHGDLVTSDLTRTELIRAIKRESPSRTVEGRFVLESLTLVSATASTFDAAGRLATDTLRSLDAIHLVTALELGDDLEGILTYDARLAEAAQANGAVVIAP